MNRKLKIFSLLNILMLVPSIVFAEDEAYTTMNKLVKVLLNAISWFGYAIALGALIFLGIKYVISGANEKANLKGRFIAYLVGIALIVMCSTVASIVADIANTDGSNTAEGIIEVGESVGNAIIEGVENTPNGSDNNTVMPDDFVDIKNEALENNDNWIIGDGQDGRVIYHVPENAEYEYTDWPGKEPYIEASDNKEFIFQYWYVKETYLDDNTVIYYKVEDKKLDFYGSDGFLDDKPTRKYEVWGYYVHK